MYEKGDAIDMFMAMAGLTLVEWPIIKHMYRLERTSKHIRRYWKLYILGINCTSLAMCNAIYAFLNQK